MLPEKKNLLEQFENEHTRTHEWVEYAIDITQHVNFFIVKGPAPAHVKAPLEISEQFLSNIAQQNI